MLQKLRQLREKEQGFTIIEVLIVLAIAALILVIVLIAIPQLQRNQRNTARKNMLTKIVAEIGSYESANGRVPSTAGHMNAFVDRYLGCSGVSWYFVTFTDDTPCDVSITDPSGGNYIFGVSGATDAAALNSEINSYDETGTNGTRLIYYKNGYVCNGDQAVAGTGRNVVFLQKLEGGAVYCASK